jgi:hypothetical protein
VALGFREIEDCGAEEIAARYAQGRTSARGGAGARLMRAATTPTAAAAVKSAISPGRP